MCNVYALVSTVVIHDLSTSSSGSAILTESLIYPKRTGKETNSLQKIYLSKKGKKDDKLTVKKIHFGPLYKQDARMPQQYYKVTVFNTPRFTCCIWNKHNKKPLMCLTDPLVLVIKTRSSSVRFLPGTFSPEMYVCAATSSLTVWSPTGIHMRDRWCLPQEGGC